MNQLALATDADISIRHLSFLETGRAHPSRAMVERLSAVLDVPLADRNVLLLAAGYAPLYGERDRAAPELDHVRRALQFILRQQEPYPALVIDRCGTSSCATRRRTGSSVHSGGRRTSAVRTRATRCTRRSTPTGCVGSSSTGRNSPAR